MPTDPVSADCNNLVATLCDNSVFDAVLSASSIPPYAYQDIDDTLDVTSALISDMADRDIFETLQLYLPGVLSCRPKKTSTR